MSDYYSEPGFIALKDTNCDKEYCKMYGCDFPRCSKEVYFFKKDKDKDRERAIKKLRDQGHVVEIKGEPNP